MKITIKKSKIIREVDNTQQINALNAKIKSLTLELKDAKEKTISIPQQIASYKAQITALQQQPQQAQEKTEI
jgi:chromosome segregation ATPase